MTGSQKVNEVIVEMMTNLDAAVDRIRDLAELLNLGQAEKETLRERGMALESDINNLKTFLRSLPSLQKDLPDTKGSLEPFLR